MSSQHEIDVTNRRHPTLRRIPLQVHTELHVPRSTRPTKPVQDNKKIVQVIRDLHREGKLNEQQSRPFTSRRPPEELYDLQSDPHELINLATDPKHRHRLTKMRKRFIKG